MSAKSGPSSIWLKLLLGAAVLAAAVIGIRQYTRPVAKVEPVVSGVAVDAKPGSVTVKEEYSMQMKAAIAGRIVSDNYHLESGMKVKQGDILVQLDTGDMTSRSSRRRTPSSPRRQRSASAPLQVRPREREVRIRQHGAALQDGPDFRQRLPERPPQGRRVSSSSR